EADVLADRDGGRRELVGIGVDVAHDSAPAATSASAGAAFLSNCSAPSGMGSPLSWAIAPDSVSSLPTVSVGWAPFWSQCTARSLSTLITDGSRRASQCLMISLNRPSR